LGYHSILSDQLLGPVHTYVEFRQIVESTKNRPQLFVDFYFDDSVDEPLHSYCWLNW